MSPEGVNDQPVDAALDRANDQPPTASADSLSAVSPDVVEQELGDQLDNVVPTRGYQQTPTVGLGGSAGGIQALGAFFDAMPPDAGFVYVVVLHLSPGHDSILDELIARHTAMPVLQAVDGTRAEADHVYVIPPGKHLTMVDGHLRLSELEPERGRRVAVDLFFRSLADTHGPHAVAVVLSGGDSDGSIGLRRIKERGGLTVVQDPGEAEQDGMPHAAIATGMVDWVLRVADMPARIRRYFASEGELRLPSEDGPQPARPAGLPTDADEAALRETLLFLRTRTGSDFTYYKRATIVRRIARRMQINEVKSLPDYLGFLRTHPGEAGALLQDLLISVTNFFRDRDAFAAVEARVPALFAGKGPNDTVRVWSAACATGEETYSLAMLLAEHARTLDYPPQIQVFGCDLDEQAVQTARAGLYPLTIAADVSEARLERFFVKTTRGYQVRRELRETVLFAQHDLLRDAPFSRMELVSCRNLLIYLDRPAQARALEVFHFALKPEGLLFLGSAETVGEEQALFTALDKKHCLFTRRANVQAGLPVPSGTGTLVRALQAQAKEPPVVPRSAFKPGPTRPSPAPRLPPAEDRTGLTELHFRLIERYAPPSLVVDERGDIVHLSENASRFLRPPGGPLTANFLQMVLPALRMEARAALLRLAESQRPVETFGVPVQVDGVPRLVDLRLSPAAETAPGYVLVTFTARTPQAGEAAADGAAGAPTDLEAVVRHLERELEGARNELHATVERAQANEEEYKSSNEELQSMNEELRSASEELETSREELQSLNEELTTVNQELKGKVEEVGHVNSDLHNLINATAIATVFLDRDLRILRFTPGAVPLFNLIPTDVGRPLGQLRRALRYPDLEADAREVQRTLLTAEREVHGPEGQTFLARLLPYRSLEDRIEGLVLTCVDISEHRRAEQVRREAEAQFRSFMEATSDTVYKMSPDWTEMRFLEGKQFLAGTDNPSRTWLETYIPSGDHPTVLATIEDAIRRRTVFELEHRVVRLDGTVGWTFSRAVPLLDERGEITEWIGAARDITGAKRSQEAVRESEEKYRALFEGVDQGFYFAEALFDEAGRCIDILYHDENAAAVRLTGQSFKGRLLSDLGPYEQYWRDEFGHVARTGEARRLERYAGPAGVWYDFYVFKPPHVHEHEFAVIFRDVTERRRAEEPLRADAERLRLAVDAVGLGTADWNYGTGEMHWNGRHFRLFGLEPEPERRMRYEDFTAVVHPQDLARVERSLRAGIEGPTGVHTEEYRVVWPDGSVHWITETARVVERRVDGFPARVISVLADLSERRASELALRASEEKYRTLFESLDEGFCVVQVLFDAADRATDYRFLEINPAFGRQSGLDGGALGRRAREITPDLEDHWFEAYGRVARTGQPERFEEYSAALGKWYNVYAWRYGAPGARQVAILFQDITERREAAERLRASEEGYRLVFESARAIGIFTLDTQENVTSWNPAAESLFGLPAADTVGRSVYRLMPGDQRELGAFGRQAEIATREGRCDCEEWFVRRDGSRFWGDGVLSPLLNNGQVTGFLKILRDATEELQAQEAREFVARERARLLEVEQAARQTAEEANAAKDHFLAVLSHELRTPLMPITMALAVLAGRADVSAPVRETLDMIQRNVNLESHLIDDLLDVTRIARGKMELARTDTDLHEAVRRAVEVSTPDIEAKGQRLTVDMSEGSCRLDGDPARLQQVFWNLLKNASKFTPTGGAIEIRARCQEGGEATVEVTDTGIGLEAGAAERIFNPFEQASTSITRQFGGLGLGLAIAKATVEAHGGVLSVSSPGLGQGATFAVRLPLTADAAS